MKDIIINVSRETRMIYLDKSIIGVDGENLQSKFIFKFKDEFVNGVARLEYIIGNDKKYLMLSKEEESYTIPVKSVLTKEGQINMQLVITEEETEQGIPIFKSNTFYIFCNKSINAEIEQPEEYPTWIEIANQKLIEVENAIEEVKQFEIEVGVLEEDVRQLGQDVNNLDIEINELTNNMNVISSEVNTHTQEINDLESKYNTLNGELLEQEQSINHLDDIKANKSEIPDISGKQDKLIAGDNIIIKDNVISSTGGKSGSSDYNELSNKPLINDIELNGNLTSHELGLLDSTDIDTITKYVDDAIKNAITSELESDF